MKFKRQLDERYRIFRKSLTLGIIRFGLLIDTKLCGRLRIFFIKEEDWTIWAFVARNYMDLLSYKYRDLVQYTELMNGPNDIVLKS